MSYDHDYHDNGLGRCGTCGRRVDLAHPTRLDEVAEAMAALRAQLASALERVSTRAEQFLAATIAKAPPAPPVPTVDLTDVERALRAAKRAVHVNPDDEARLTDALKVARIAHLVDVRTSPYVEPGTMILLGRDPFVLDEAIDKLAEPRAEWHRDLARDEWTYPETDATILGEHMPDELRPDGTP